MASPAQPGPVDPDTLITVKVSFKGGIRRFKLPLRDLGPNVLPGKVSDFLYDAVLKSWNTLLRGAIEADDV